MRQIQEQLQHGFEAHRYTNCERTLTDMETQTDATIPIYPGNWT